MDTGRKEAGHLPASLAVFGPSGRLPASLGRSLSQWGYESLDVAWVNSRLLLLDGC